MSATADVTKPLTVLRRRLVICCDGTWNDSVSTKSPLTNVSRISRCIKAVSDRDGVLQIVYYHTGVGTGTSKIGKSVDGATGRGIGANIRNAYTFICQNYHDENDEIFLIGFSRGAFTVRCVASLIDQVGLLHKRGLSSLYDVYRLWKRQREPADPKTGGPSPLQSLQKLCVELKNANLVRLNVEIKACAVWDTVSAMGLPMPVGMPQPKTTKLGFVDEKLCRSIKHAFHALALDERRRQFKPLLWRSPDPRSELKQCWFLGAHSDVGGGYDDAALANITLIWMIAQLDQFLDFDCDTLWDLTAAKVVRTVEHFEQHGEQATTLAKFPTPVAASDTASLSSATSSTNASSALSRQSSSHVTISERKPAAGKVQESLAGVFRFGGAIKRIPGQLQTARAETSFHYQLGPFPSRKEKKPETRVDKKSQPEGEDRAAPEQNNTIHFTVRLMLGKKINTSKALKYYYTHLNPDQEDRPKVSWRVSKESTKALGFEFSTGYAPIAFGASFGISRAVEDATIHEDHATALELELLRECMERDSEFQYLVNHDSNPAENNRGDYEERLSKTLLPLLSEADNPTISVTTDTQS